MEGITLAEIVRENSSFSYLFLNTGASIQSYNVISSKTAKPYIRILNIPWVGNGLPLRDGKTVPSLECVGRALSSYHTSRGDIRMHAVGSSQRRRSCDLPLGWVLCPCKEFYRRHLSDHHRI